MTRLNNIKLTGNVGGRTLMLGHATVRGFNFLLMIVLYVRDSAGLAVVTQGPHTYVVN